MLMFLSLKNTCSTDWVWPLVSVVDITFDKFIVHLVIVIIGGRDTRR